MLYIDGKSQKQKSLFIDDNFATLEKIDPLDDSVSNINRDFHFKFHLKISQIAAIKENAYSVSFTLKSKNKLATVIVPSYGTNEIDSQQVIDNILTNSLKIRKQDVSQQLSIIIEKTIDITSKIDNQFLTAVKLNIQDFSMFSKTKVLVKKRKNPNDITAIDLNNNVLTKTLFGELGILKRIPKNDASSIKKRFALLNSSISPSSITSTSNKTMSPYAALTGCIQALPKDNSRNSLINSLSLFHHLEEIDNEINEKQENPYVTIIDKKFDDLLNVNLNVVLKESFMYQPHLIAEFKLIKRIYDKRKNVQEVVIETVQKNFDMKYYYDNFMPNLRPLSVGIQRKNSEVILQIKNTNNSSCGAIIFGKYIKNFNESSFKNIKTTTIDCKNQISFAKIFDSNTDAIYRVVAFDLKSNALSNDFTDVIVRNPRNIYNNDVVVIPYLQAGKINLKIINNSYNFGVVACKILIRNVTKKTTNYFAPYVIQFEDGKKEYNKVIAANLIPYNSYELTTKLIYENGVEIYSNNSNIVQVFPYSGNVSTTSILDRNISNDVTFSLRSQFIRDKMSQITELLSQVSGLYNTEYYLSKQNDLDKFICFQILRYNLLNGDCDDLGIITNGSNFSDSVQSALRGTPPVISGGKYMYVIYPLIRDPETITETNKEFIDVETKKRYQANIRKHRHPLTIKRGNVLSKQRIDNDIVNDMLYGMVGHSETFIAEVGNQNPPLIKNLKARFITNKRVILDWNLDGDINKFDHILIFKEESGIRTIIGKTHCFETNYNFIYDLTQHDVGNIRFILVPILRDYSTGASVISNYILVNNIG